MAFRGLSNFSSKAAHLPNFYSFIQILFIEKYFEKIEFAQNSGNGKLLVMHMLKGNSKIMDAFGYVRKITRINLVS